MDITSLYNVSSNVINQAAQANPLTQSKTEGEDLFGNILNSAIDNIKLTNSYAKEAQTEKLKLAMGETENTHDLTIAAGKASTALQYTIAIRDKFMEAYKEIMQMQI